MTATNAFRRRTLIPKETTFSHYGDPTENHLFMSPPDEPAAGRALFVSARLVPGCGPK